jgi:hypothetical protein
MGPPETRERSRRRLVRWNDLPHGRLSAEIDRDVAFRQPSEAHAELQLEELRPTLREVRGHNHRDYTRLISGEMVRELRICRDTYRDYLAKINDASRTAKWSVVLDFAVAPRASRRLRQEICAYLHHAEVRPLVVEILFAYGGRLVMTEHGIECKERSIDDVVGALIPERSFEGLKAQVKHSSFRVGGPFARLQFACGFSFGLRGDEILRLYRDNQFWISQIGRMWDNILREIVAQQVQIDLEERSDALAAIETLSPFDGLAGRLYLEASDRYHTIPDEIWKKIGSMLDASKLRIGRNLEPEGKKLLAKLARQGISVTKWEDALVCRDDYGLIERKKVTANRVKYCGMLNRHAKRAVYRARDKYRAVLDRVYETHIKRRFQVR